MHLSRFDPEARQLRLETVLHFLRVNNRGDGVVLATSKDVLRHLEHQGEPVHTLRAVRDYISTLRQQGLVETIPFSPDLDLPTKRHHGYKHGVLKLINTRS